MLADGCNRRVGKGCLAEQLLLVRIQGAIVEDIWVHTGVSGSSYRRRRFANEFVSLNVFAFC